MTGRIIYHRLVATIREIIWQRCFTLVKQYERVAIPSKLGCQEESRHFGKPQALTQFSGHGRRDCSSRILESTWSLVSIQKASHRMSYPGEAAPLTVSISSTT